MVQLFIVKRFFRKAESVDLVLGADGSARGRVLGLDTTSGAVSDS